MVIGDKLVIFSTGFSSSGAWESLDYIKSEYKDYDAQSVEGDIYAEAVAVSDNTWRARVSFQLYQDIDIWFRVDNHLVIDKDYNTYLIVRANKMGERTDTGCYAHFYIKFNKSLVTEICEISGMTKEQAVLILQILLITRDDKYTNKIANEFSHASSKSIIKRIIAVKTELETAIADDVKNYVSAKIAEAIDMDSAICLMLKNESSYCLEHDKSCLGSYTTHMTKFINCEHVVVTLKKDIINHPTFDALEESDDIIYTDNIKKVLEQKGIDEYISEAQAEKLAKELREYKDAEEDADSFVLTPSNIAGLSHFGGKLVRIL